MGGGEEEKRAFFNFCFSCLPFPQLTQHRGAAVSLRQEYFGSFQSCFPLGGDLQNLLQALLMGLLPKGITVSCFPPWTPIDGSVPKGNHFALLFSSPNPPAGQFCAAAASKVVFFFLPAEDLSTPPGQPSPRNPQQLHPSEIWGRSLAVPSWWNGVKRIRATCKNSWKWEKLAQISEEHHKITPQVTLCQQQERNSVLLAPQNPSELTVNIPAPWKCCAPIWKSCWIILE